MTVAITLALLFVLLALGIPVAFTLAIAGAAGLLMVGGPTLLYGILESAPLSALDSFEFITIPMFILMAQLLTISGIADNLFSAAAVWLGRIKGGLAIATAITGAAFGAISGSSTASAATLSSTSIPAMMQQGYERKFASGVVAISGTLAMLIPPSIAMIIYGLLADVNIGKLLIAGVVPAVLVTAAIMLTTYVLAKRDPSCAPLSAKVTWGEKFRLLRLVAPMLVLMMAVTGVIYTGVATPTEASAMGALVSAILYFMRGRRTWAEVADLFGRATRTSCMVAIILLGAHVFTVFFALTQTTQSLIGWVGALPVEPWVIIVALTLMYLVLGCFLDQIAILVLTVPIVAPLVSSLGFDLIWFGVIKIVTAELGMVTPPLGLNCFVVSKYSRTPVQDVFRGTLPHVAAHLVVLAVLLLFPALSLWLPSQMR